MIQNTRRGKCGNSKRYGNWSLQLPLVIKRLNGRNTLIYLTLPYRPHNDLCGSDIKKEHGRTMQNRVT